MSSETDFLANPNVSISPDVFNKGYVQVPDIVMFSAQGYADDISPLTQSLSFETGPWFKAGPGEILVQPVLSFFEPKLKSRPRQRRKVQSAKLR